MVRVVTISSSISAIGQTITLEYKHNPFKIAGTNKFHPQIADRLVAWRKEAHPSTKKLPVEADITEFLVNVGQNSHTSLLKQTIEDFAMIAFCFLLQIGVYTNKAKRSSTKQMVHFKFEDVTIFQSNSNRQLRCLPQDAPDDMIATADSTTLKLDN
jgi:hypothetical protein